MEAIRDQNFVPSALFESSSTPGLTITGKINQSTGRILVDASAGGVTEVDTGTGLTGGPITTTGTISLSVPLQPMATLAGNSLKVLRVNVGETAVEYATISSGLTVGTTVISSGTTTRILYDNAGVLGEYTISGSGTVVAMATSPVFTTPTLGVATATTVNKLTITTPATGSTLTIIDGKTLTVNKTISFTAADDTGVYTLPTGTKTLVATDVATLSNLQTVGTIIGGVWNGTAVSAAFGGTGHSIYSDGQLLIGKTSTGGLDQATLTAGTGISITNGGGSITIATTGSGTPTMKITTTFETAARFDVSGKSGSGATNFNTTGLYLQTGATGTSYQRVLWKIANTTNAKLFLGSPVFSTQLMMNDVNEGSGTGTTLVCIGQVTVDGTSHTLTDAHTGFKLVKTGGVISVYATQADGSTENASSALTTVTNQDFIEFIIKINSTTSIDYYWRKNGGALSSATNLTANMPTGTNTNIMQFSTTNQATAFDYNMYLAGASYER